MLEKKNIKTMVNFTEVYSNFLEEQGLDTDISKYMKKKLRQSVEKEFIDALHLLQMENGKLLLIPANISVFELAVENFELKKQIEEHSKNLTRKTEKVMESAKILRKEIFENKLF